MASVSQPVTPSQPASVAAGGATVAIPANALAQAVTLTLSEYPASSAPTGQGALQVSFMPDVFLIDTGGVEPQAGSSVTITLPYNPADIPAGDTALDLSISYFDGTQWVTLPVVLDTVNHTLAVVTDHFSWWAVTYRENTPTPVPVNRPPVVYPNPAPGNQVRLNLPSLAAPGDVKVQVYTEAYRKVKDETFRQVLPGSDVTLKLADKEGETLSDGLYYLVVTTPQGKSILKLIVLR